MRMLIRAMLVLSSCLFALSILEIAVRVLDVRPRPIAPLRIASYRLSDNPILGYEYLPNYKPFSINSEGFRDSEHTKKKPEGLYRIIILGDSTTAGETIDLDKAYPKQLEKLLGTKYEVLNMAVSGYHTLQEVETLRVKGLKYDPDLVIVTVCVNDFDPHGDGGLARLSASSALYNRVLRVSRLAFVLHHRLRLADRLSDHSYERNILKRRTTVRAGFELLSELQREHGFSVLAVILPAFDYPFSNYQHSEIHKQVIQSANVPVVDLLPRFAAVDNAAGKFSYDRLHLNEAGHKVMAGILLPLILTASRE